MPLLKRVRVLAAKIEATPGTAESLLAADADYNCYDVEIQPDIDTNQRMQQGSMSNLPNVPGAYGGTVTFRTDLIGNGAAASPQWADAFFPACGFVEALDTFSPTSEAPGSNVKTLTIGVYENGLYKQIRGAAGSFRIICPTGRPAQVEFTFRGIWDNPSDVAILAPTYPTDKPLRAANATFTMGGAAYSCIENMTIDVGNNVILRECTDDASGYESALITDRNITVTMNPEAQLVATENPYGFWTAMTEEALSYALTDGTDTITIAAPKMQVINVQESDRGGNQVDEITFQANASAAAGDDELTIDFS